MTDFILSHEFNGVAVAQRATDGYVDATTMCKANGKVVHDYLRLKSAQVFLDTLATAKGIPLAKLVVAKEGGIDQGTWIHPKVAIHLGQWCSAEFAVWVADMIFDWMTLQTQQQATKTPTELLHEATGRLVEQERRVKALEAGHNQLRAEVKANSAELTRFNNTHGRYYSICGYAAMHGIELPLNLAAKMGKSASAMCRQLGLPISDIPDPRFGVVI